MTSTNKVDTYVDNTLGEKQQQCPTAVRTLPTITKATSSRMTQSFSFQEPEAMVIPGSSSDKGQKRWSDGTMRGMYVDQLQPNGRSVRLSNDSFPSSNTSMGQCHVDNSLNNFGEADRLGGYYTRMVESSSHGIPLRAPGVDIGFNGTLTDCLGTNATSTQCMTENANFGASAHVSAQSYANIYANYNRQGSINGGRSQDVSGGVSGQAFANLQALFDHRRGLQGMNPSRLTAPGIDSQNNHGVNNVHAPTPYPQRTQFNSSDYNLVARFGSTAGDHLISSTINQNGFGNSSQSVTLPFGDAGHGGNNSWPDLLSCQTDSVGINIASQSNKMFDSRLGMADDGSFMRPQSPSTPRGHQGINTVLSDAQQDYLQEIQRLNSMTGEMEDTPDRKSQGRWLAYTVPAQPSPRDNIFDCPATDIPNIEQSQQDGIYSQTYELQPHIAPADGIDIGDKGDPNDQKFDLNEVPGYAEATPKRRKKYHPIVAKDKRTYKKRKVDGNNQNSQSKKPGLNVEHDTAVCDCETCIKIRLERRVRQGKESGHEGRWNNADSMTITSEANEMVFSRSPDARLSGGAGDVFSFAQSPVSPPESHSRSWGTPNSSSKSPSVRRNLFATQPPAQEEQPALSSSLDVAAAGLDQGNGARSCHYNVGENLATLEEMLARHKELTTAMSRRRNLLSQELHPDTALHSSYGGVQSGTIEPARVKNPGLQIEITEETYTNSFNQIRSVCSSNNSFLSRLCPRGILNPQEVPFRNMSKIQRVVYLKWILMSQRLDMTSESLLQHVHGHLPANEKEEFKSLWDLILTPATNDQMQQLAQLAEMELPTSELTPILQSEYQTSLEKRKPKVAKKPTRRELPLNSSAMTLWPDLMQEQSNPKPVKEKRGRKAGNNVEQYCQERQNSNGNIDPSQGLEMVPFENKSMVPYDGPFNPLRKRRTRPKVVLDSETVREWKLLMDKKGTLDTVTDAEKELKWDEERRKMKAQALRFIDRMHTVQGDRSFSCWKGSVVDSIVGAYLTQNVNDVLSSSAFMSMRSRFPGRGFRKEAEEANNEENTDVVDSSESELVHPPPPTKTSVEFDLQEPKISQEASSTYKPTSVQPDNTLHSAEPPQHVVLESQESRNEESYKVYLPTKESQTSTQPPQESQSTIETWSDSEQSQTAAKSSNSESGLEIQGAAIVTVNAATTEESSGNTGSELVEGNQPSHGKFNPKTGLTGLERAKREEEQVTARKSFDFSALQAEFKPRIAGQERPAAPPRPDATKDGVDWEAVRGADVAQVADVIKERGLNWILAGRIKAFLERIHRDYGELDLEWLRSMSSDQTKDFLLSIRGLGLKSVECIRLLTLHHLAFPVDTNVGRICVRLGWVPLEPLPEELQLHLLELYPVQATIQKYLWPRLCKLDQATLYELHYQMITFGKVFCTKSKPNCNACPMRPECKHFASALSSAKLALPPSERPNNGPPLALPPGTGENFPEASHPEPARSVSQYVCQPIVEEPMTPESEADMEDLDIEDYPFSVEEVEQEEAEILNICTHMQKSNITEPEPVQEIVPEADPGQQQVGIDSDRCAIQIVDSNDDEGVSVTQPTGDVLAPANVAPSQEMVLVAPGVASLPVPKLKNVGRLRTVHYVYELPDNHALLDGLDPREADDPCTYLLAIWSPGEVPESIPNINDNVNEDNTFAPSSSEGEEESIKATLLVPCRTAMKGSFPLNGTYFQVNEVFADHESSLQPILVPRKLLWHLRRRFVYFGTTVTSIFRGMTVEEIQACFWRGYVCVRGFDRTTRAPKPLVGRLHLHPGKSSGKGAKMDA